jgi:hypothetical protein
MSERQVPSVLERCYGKLPLDTRKIFQKLVKRISPLEIVQESLKWYAGSGKARCAPHNLGIT